MKILLDTNIILDLLLERESFCFEAKEIFLLVENNKVEFFMCHNNYYDLLSNLKEYKQSKIR